MSDFQDCKDEVGSYTIDGVEYALTQLPKLIVLGKDNVLFVATAFTESMQDGDGKFAATDSKDFVELNWDCTEWYNDVDALGEWPGDWEAEVFVGKEAGSED